MVYCTECGFKNSDDARYCTKCGAELEFSREADWERRVDEWGEDLGRHLERECFTIPGGGSVIGMIFGVFIIIVGISIMIGESIWRWIGPSFIILIGMLIIAGVLYRTLR